MAKKISSMRININGSGVTVWRGNQPGSYDKPTKTSIKRIRSLMKYYPGGSTRNWTSYIR